MAALQKHGENVQNFVDSLYSSGRVLRLPCGTYVFDRSWMHVSDNRYFDEEYLKDYGVPTYAQRPAVRALVAAAIQGKACEMPVMLLAELQEKLRLARRTMFFDNGQNLTIKGGTVVIAETTKDDLVFSDHVIPALTCSLESLKDMDFAPLMAKLAPFLGEQAATYINIHAAGSFGERSVEKLTLAYFSLARGVGKTLVASLRVTAEGAPARSRVVEPEDKKAFFANPGRGVLADVKRKYGRCTDTVIDEAGPKTKEDSRQQPISMAALKSMQSAVQSVMLPGATELITQVRVGSLMSLTGNTDDPRRFFTSSLSKEDGECVLLFEFGGTPAGAAALKAAAEEWSKELEEVPAALQAFRVQWFAAMVQAAVKALDKPVPCITLASLSASEAPASDGQANAKKVTDFLEKHGGECIVEEEGATMSTSAVYELVGLGQLTSSQCKLPARAVRSYIDKRFAERPEMVQDAHKAIYKGLKLVQSPGAKRIRRVVLGGREVGAPTTEM